MEMDGKLVDVVGLVVLVVIKIETDYIVRRLRVICGQNPRVFYFQLGFGQLQLIWRLQHNFPALKLGIATFSYEKKSYLLDESFFKSYINLESPKHHVVSVNRLSEN